MMPDDDDRDLHRLLGELREADERDAPDFEATIARARARPVRPARRGPARRHVFATAIVLAAAAVLVVARRVSREPAPATVVIALAHWRSPTDFLLYPPGTLGASSSITGSVIPDVPLRLSPEKTP